MVSELIDYFAQFGPTILILSFGGWVLYGMYRREREENNELHNYIREADVRNLELLRDFSGLLDNLSNINETNTKRIIDSVQKEAFTIKEHIDNSVKNLEKRCNKNCEGK